MMILKYIKSCIVIMIVVLCGAQYVHADLQTHPEYEVKAAFIYNFLNLIDWPIDQELNDTINLCVVGKNQFGTTLENVDYSVIGNKTLVVKYVQSFQDIGDSNVVFVSSSEKRRLKQIHQTLTDTNVLTIGDTKGFAQQGVIINFYIKDDNVHFEVNMDAAKRAGLKISSKLLRLAKIVYDMPIRKDK
jgi:hypothetical protein